MNKIVFTDLDGTLTLRDTYVDFLFRFVSYDKIVSNISLLIKILFLYLIKRATNDDVKIATFKIFFKNITLKEARKKVSISLNNIKWNNKVINMINELKRDGYRVVLVTASLDIYVKYICDKLGFDDFIATKTEILDDKFTGKFDGKICNFKEKVNRIKKRYPNIQHSISFGNSKGDLAMLNFCNKSYFVNKNSITLFKNS